MAIGFYQSDMPVFKNEGTLWIKTVIYLSYPDCQLLYELLKDYKQWQVIQKHILSLSKMSYEEGYSLLRKHQISKQHCQVLFKVLGMTDHILSSSVILDLVKISFIYHATKKPWNIKKVCSIVYIVFYISEPMVSMYS